MATATTSSNPLELTPAERAANKSAAKGVVQAVSDAGSAIAGSASTGAGVVSGVASDAQKSVEEKGIWGSITGFFGSMWESISGFLGMSGDPEKDKKGLNVGSLMGGGLFAFLGYFLGSSVGGIPGMVLGGAMALCGIVMGTQFGDKTINGWLGREPQRTYTPATGTPVQYVGRGQEQVAATDLPYANPAAAASVSQASASPLIDGQAYQQFRSDVRSHYGAPLNSQVAGLGTYAPMPTPNASQSFAQPTVGWRIRSS